MDPIANLKEQLSLAREIRASWGDCNADGTLTPDMYTDVASKAEELAELVLALDEWMRKDGFSPWSKSIR
jgi:hypothetical protein